MYSSAVFRVSAPLYLTHMKNNPLNIFLNQHNYNRINRRCIQLNNGQALRRYYRPTQAVRISDSPLLQFPNLNCIVRLLHLSVKMLKFDCEIPDWMKEVANEVPELKENLLSDGMEGGKEYTLEDNIVNFFLSRAIEYEELETSFIVSCPSCCQQEHSHDLFIDKNSGYGVCPGCLWEGCWEDFIDFLNLRGRILVKSTLENIISASVPIEEAHESLIESFPFNLGIEKFQEIGARISLDQTQVLLPLKGENGVIVGVAAISLLHRNPEIVIRMLENEKAVFSSGLNYRKTTKKVVVTSDIMSTLKLAKLKIPALVLIGNHNEESYTWALQHYKNLILWLEDQIVPDHLLSYLMSRNINTFLVKAGKDQRLMLLNNSKIASLVTEAIPVDKESILMFSDIESEVYSRIINKEKIYGTQWVRFKDMNYFLLGHRRGELTVLSGPTGSGKTTFVSEYSLDLCTQGVCTLWGSFEISIARLCEVMLQQYSGSQLSENYSVFKVLASKFSELPLYFFNAHGQQPLNDVINVMIKAIKLRGIEHVVIDNLQFMLGANGSTSDWWLEQDRAVSAFRQFATSYNCHVTLIVHPRKLALGEKLNLNTVSGGARVTQEADNVLLLQVSENKDGSRNPLGPKTLQIVKNRYGGSLGEIKLRFHKDSLTLSSCFSHKKKESHSQDPIFQFESEE